MHTGQLRRLEITELLKRGRLTSKEVKEKIMSAKPSTVQTDLYILHKAGKIRKDLDGWVAIDQDSN